MDATEAVRLLAEPRYEVLRLRWEDYLSKQTGRISRDRIDVEDFAGILVSRREELSANPNRDAAWWTEMGEVSRALGCLWYFLFELFKTFSASPSRADDNYRKLARSHRTRPFAAISLNYDALLERAIEAEGLTYVYAPDYRENSIPIIKVHGSVTWLNPAGRGIAFGGGVGRDDLFRQVTNTIYSNRIWLSPLRYLSVQECGQGDVWSLLRSGTDYDVPGLLPPLGGHKDYDQLGVFQAVWDMARLALSYAKSVSFVGTQLRAEDKQLCDAVALTGPNWTQVQIAGGYDKVRPRIDTLAGWTRRRTIPRFDTFAHWADSL